MLKMFDVATKATIDAQDTIVEELGNRNGDRKVSARLALLRMREEMHPTCIEGIEQQIEAWRRMHGVMGGIDPWILTKSDVHNTLKAHHKLPASCTSVDSLLIH
eukprot:SAG31_NODE_3794_length_3876_cov_2.497485_5_plen_104_part_00